jgi:hypothetical protein
VVNACLQVAAPKVAKPVLQSLATRGNRCRRIVAPKVAGSSSVDHLSFLHRAQGKGSPRHASRLGAIAAYRDTRQSGCLALFYMGAVRNRSPERGRVGRTPYPSSVYTVIIMPTGAG